MPQKTQQVVMYGRPYWARGFWRRWRVVWERSCIRPVGAVGRPLATMGCADRVPGIAARSRGAMTKRSIPTQVLTLVPSLPLLLARSLSDHLRPAGRTAASPAVGGPRPAELRTSRRAEWSWLRLLLRLWVTHRRYPQPIRPRRFCEAARSRLRPGSPRRCGRSWPPAPAPPPSPAGGRGCRAAIPLRDRCASGRCA